MEVHRRTLDRSCQYAVFPADDHFVLQSTGTNRLLVPPVKRSTVGSRAFPVAGPKTCWNVLPEDVTYSQSEYTFRRQLKTWLFEEVFSGHHLILTAS